MFYVPNHARVARPACGFAQPMLLRILVALSLVPLLATSLLSADDTQPDIEKQRAEEATARMLDHAQKYEFIFADQTFAQLNPEPILRWTNPARGSVHGSVFLWTRKARPEVVGSLFQWYSPFTHMSHEFQSLSTQPLSAQYDSGPVWTTPKGGVEFQTVEVAPPPAKSAPLRLAQMRKLAGQFSAIKRDRDDNQQELRLLTQPIYRYESTDPQITDGGLFVFVQGTDPEVFLLLEARHEAGADHWEYALARMNSVNFTVSFGDRQVWSVEIVPWNDVYSHREPYTSFGFNRKNP